MKPSFLLVLFFVGACGGESFVSEAVSLSPDSGGFVDSQRDPATDGDGRQALRDVLADPWPDDVEVSRVDSEVMDAAVEKTCAFGGSPATGCPCINCFIFDGPNGSVDHIACCDGSGNPGDSSNDRLCNQGDFPTPHKGYCSSCSCQLTGTW